MATTTPNFGWTVPTSTDLVKDGATAIETLGDGVDASFVGLKGGTTGQVLSKASGTDLAFTWASAGASGKVLQVVQATTSTATTSTSITWADTGLSASITPSLTTSKILVITAQAFRITSSSNFTYGGFRLQRGSTNIFGSTGANSPTNSSIYTSNSSAMEFNDIWNFSYLDSPATTSATTYKTQQAIQTAISSNTIISQFYSMPSSIILLEIGA